MAGIGSKWWGLRRVALILVTFVGVASVLVSAERTLKQESSSHDGSREVEPGLMTKIVNFLWDPNLSAYEHVWPVSCKNFSVFETLTLCLVAEKTLEKERNREREREEMLNVRQEKGHKIHIS